MSENELGQLRLENEKLRTEQAGLRFLIEELRQELEDFQGIVDGKFAMAAKIQSGEIQPSKYREPSKVNPREPKRRKRKRRTVDAAPPSAAEPTA